MTALKINPAKLPYRGEPTKDRRPAPWKVPEDIKVVKAGNKTLQTEHDAWKKKHVVHTKRGAKNNNVNKWSEEDLEKAMEMYWQGIDFSEIAKAVKRTECATRTQINLRRRAMGLKERKVPGRQGANKWQAEEDELLIRMWHDGKSAKEIGEMLPDRSERGVYSRIFTLRELGKLYIENRKRRF